MRGRASTASVATLAKSGVARPGFPCRIASKSGEYPHRSLPFRQAMHGGTHSRVLQNFSRAYLLQNLVGKHLKPFNNFKEIGCAPAELNINLSSESESGIFGVHGVQANPVLTHIRRSPLGEGKRSYSLSQAAPSSPLSSRVLFHLRRI